MDSGGVWKCDVSAQYLTANIMRVPDRRDTFRADFRLHERSAKYPSEPVTSFILLRVDDANTTSLNVKPRSISTSDPAIFALAKDWVEECCSSHPTCSEDRGTFYPTRLIKVGSQQDSPDFVQLVSQQPDEKLKHRHPHFSGDYVTLSHRWGHMIPKKLCVGNLDDFQTMIHVRDLSLTFQHAITIARMLNISWIWIDALCIIQDDQKDWLRESASMKQVYMNSFCNLSATAAHDSTGGMFRERDRTLSWTEVVTLKVDFDTPEAIRCTILDLSFWSEMIEAAPVNKRSWVLQERLLSRRVLHWCADQIAFECQVLDRAECRPQGLPHVQEIKGALIDAARFKRFDASAGKDLRIYRLNREGSSGKRKLLNMMANPIQEGPRWLFYEVWKQMIDKYSKMQLTKAEDRLIALSGVAGMMADRMASDNITDQYIAGLWQRGLASQLLWYVNEADGPEPQPLDDLRPKDVNGKPIYRAPTFSWASVETPRGVTFAVSQKHGLRIKLEVVRLIYRSRSDNFGILDDGYITIKGVLRRIILTDSHPVDLGEPVHSEPMDIQQDDRLILRFLANIQSTFSGSFLSLICASIMLQIGAMDWSILISYLADTPFALMILLLVGVCYLSINSLSSSSHTPPLPSPLPTPVQVPQITRNRWRWRLIREGQLKGLEHSVVYLDSPASQPTIFGLQGNVYIIPALIAGGRLVCLMVQAIEGDYGVRYKRIGLTRVSTTYEEEVADIVTPPGKNASSHGRYYYGPAGRQTGESTICII